MMSRKPGEARDHTLNLPLVNLRRELRIIEECTMKVQRRLVDSLSRREPRVVLGRGPEANLHQRQVVNPVVASQLRPERRF